MKKLYSLWIVPPPKIREILQKIVSELSFKYHSPNFEPHMTLLGNTFCNKKEMLEKTGILASKLKPLQLFLGEISFSTTYFQSVFVRIKSSARLMNANLTAKGIYQKENDVFMPHISLVYGNHPMEERERIVSEIKMPKNLSFKAEKIIVTPSTQDPAEWVHLAEFKIK